MRAHQLGAPPPPLFSHGGLCEGLIDTAASLAFLGKHCAYSRRYGITP